MSELCGRRRSTRSSVGRSLKYHLKPAQVLASGACDRWRGIRCVPPALSQKGLRFVSTLAGSYQVRFLVNQWEQCNQLCRIAQNLAEDRAQRHHSSQPEPTHNTETLPIFRRIDNSSSLCCPSLNPWLDVGLATTYPSLPNFPILNSFLTSTFPSYSIFPIPFHVSPLPILLYPSTLLSFV